MSLQLSKTASASGVPVWQKVYDLLPGGFTLVITNLAVGNKVVAGTPLLCSETSRTATVVKTATMQASAGNTDTDYKVLKGHHFKVGDYLASVVGGKAYAITAIDTTNAAYDLLTVGTTLAVVLAAGDVLFQSSATGASAAALTATPNALLHEEAYVVDGYTAVNGVVRGNVFERRIPGLLSTFKTALKGIIFSGTY